MKPNPCQPFRSAAAVPCVLLVMAVAFCSPPPNVLAQAVPDRMNYQGILLTGQGIPITVPTDVEFRIWDSPTLTETNGLKWGRMFRVTPDTNGVFNVVLSQEGAPLSGAPDVNLAGVFTGTGSDSRYLELTVVGSTAIRPRQRFVASPYAFLAYDLTPRQDFTVGGVLTAGGAANVGSLNTPGAVTATTMTVRGAGSVGTLTATGAVTAASFVGSGAGLTEINTNNLVQQIVEALCPPGTIVAFAGTNIPSGWLLCDGRGLAQSAYPRLFSAISTNWGSTNLAASFNLPDLRGMFLRGVNGTRLDGAGPNLFDADANSRTNWTRGNLGNAVGSVQLDALQNLTGTVGSFDNYAAIKGTTDGAFYRNYNVGKLGGIGSGANDQYDEVKLDASKVARTSTETRPRNAYVNYIIKY
jgi:microcystin-dependent protein